MAWSIPDTAMIGRIGPKTSSRMIRIPWSTFVSTVGETGVVRRGWLATEPDYRPLFDRINQKLTNSCLFATSREFLFQQRRHVTVPDDDRHAQNRGEQRGEDDPDTDSHEH